MDESSSVIHTCRKASVHLQILKQKRITNRDIVVFNCVPVSGNDDADGALAQSNT